MNAFKEGLSESVRCYPHLYNSLFQDNKDTQKTQSSWTEIRFFASSVTIQNSYKYF